MEYLIDIKEDLFEATLSEKITFSDLYRFKKMVKHMVASSSTCNIFNLSEVEFIDSAGLGMLLLARDETLKTSSNLILKAPKGQVLRMFNVARFDQMFNIVND
ncbi:MAG: STAS domain-containing protein [Emcibacter sp.]|nr:STAS domain-containing protein [Emcibacter sp.]